MSMNLASSNPNAIVGVSSNILAVSTLLALASMQLFDQVEAVQKSSSGDSKKDYYEILGVPRDSTQQQIKKAFRKLAVKYHPDKNKEEGAEDKFREIAKAYDTLSDKEKRKRYDQFGEDEQRAHTFQHANFQDIFHNFDDMFGNMFHHSEQHSGSHQHQSSHQGSHFSFSFDDFFEDSEEDPFDSFFSFASNQGGHGHQHEQQHAGNSHFGSSFFGNLFEETMASSHDSHYVNHGHHSHQHHHQQQQCHQVTKQVQGTIISYTECH